MSAPPPRRPRLVAGLLVGLALLAVAGLLATGGRWLSLDLPVEQARLQAAVARLGPFGPLAIVLLQAAQVLLAPIPGQAVGVASGCLYGPWLGTLYSLVGLVAGSWLGVWLVRRWGRPLVERLVSGERLARLDGFARRLGAPLLFLIYLLPFLPDDAILLVAGLTPVPLGAILLAATLGRLPGVFVSAWVGAHAAALTPGQWLLVLAVVVALAAPAYRYRARLERLSWAILERITGQR